MYCIAILLLYFIHTLSFRRYKSNSRSDGIDKTLAELHDVRRDLDSVEQESIEEDH